MVDVDGRIDMQHQFVRPLYFVNSIVSFNAMQLRCVSDPAHQIYFFATLAPNPLQKCNLKAREE